MVTAEEEEAAEEEDNGVVRLAALGNTKAKEKDLLQRAGEGELESNAFASRLAFTPHQCQNFITLVCTSTFSH